MLLRKHLLFLLLAPLLIGVLLLAHTKMSYSNTILLQEDFNDGNQNDGQPVDWEEIFDNGNWSVQDGKYIGTIASYSGVNPRTLAGDLNWDNYALEATLTDVSGVDRHLLFRFDQNRPVPRGYALKYTDSQIGSNPHIELQKAGLTVLTANQSFISNVGESHRVRIEGIGNHIKVFVDGEKRIDYIDEVDPILNGKIGLLIESSGGGFLNTTAYDDILVEQISTFSDETTSPTPLTPSPTPQPTIAPTPTPVPTATPNVLSVTDIKQYSPPWGDDTYDTATKWTTNPTIERWGCALTSASMILNFYGHNINPDALNNWLKSQSDGYIGSGLINWLAVSRYTKQHDTANTPTLEYRRLGGNLSDLDNELNNGRPSILKLPGHFVVGKGKNGSEYVINDPATNNTSLNYYGGSFLALNQFKPSHTDLSYLLLTIDPTFSLKVFNPTGNEIVGSFYVDEPLIDQVNGTDTSGGHTGIFIYPTPADGKYKVEVIGPTGEYTLYSYLYDKDGNVTPQTFTGIIQTGQIDTFNILYGDNSQTTTVITINSIIDDWNTGFANRNINNKLFYNSVKSLLMTAKNYINVKNGKQKVQAKAVLQLAKQQIGLYTPTYITPQYSQIIISEIDTLVNSL